VFVLWCVVTALLQETNRCLLQAVLVSTVISEFTSFSVSRRATSAETTYAETDFLINSMLKRGAWFQEIYIKQDKICIHEYEQFTKQNMTWETSENLRGSYFPLNYGWVTCIIICNIWTMQVWMDARINMTARQISSLYSVLIVSKHSHNSWPSCCSLPFRLNVFKNFQ
jgi:hypothetical protein